MVIIGISGKKQSGKDEACKLITKWFAENQPHTNVHRVAFADALKSEVAKACGVTKEYLELHKKSFRLILQGWGTDWKRRLVKDTYWIEQYYRRTLTLPKEDVIITPDVRFLNEYNTLRDVGAYMWRVYRLPIEDITSFSDCHQSELELDKGRCEVKWNLEIDNNKNLQHLEQQINNELNKIITK